MNVSWRSIDIWSLAFAEVIVWSAMFYLFPASLIEWQNHFDWSLKDISFALSIALAVSAVAGVFTGRVIDLGLGRLMMSMSALVGGILLFLLTTINAIWQFYLIWALIGLAMAGCLYQPCFSFLIRKYGAQAKGAIIIITLVAGLAGTFCFPVSNLIISHFDWEKSVMFFASLNVLIATPLFWFAALENKGKANVSEHKPSEFLSTVIGPMLSNPLFWGITISFGLLALNHIMITSHILPLIESRGMKPEDAVMAASFIGVSQVIGRLSLFILEKRSSMTSIYLMFLMLLAVASLFFLAVSYLSIFLVFSIMLQGISWGILGVIKPFITADLLGQSNFGILSASADIFYRFGYALAPAMAGVISSSFGYTGVLITASSFAIAAFLVMMLSLRNVKHVGMNGNIS
jgi:MFS family permease